MDLSDVDFGLLLALDALLKARNVTHAAIRLGVSQPALSARLGRLRQLFADPLFVPATAGRGVVPTPRAAGLQGELASVLAQLQNMLERPAEFDPAQSRQTFIVAMYENPAAILLPGLVSRVMASAPGARISIVTPKPDVTDHLEAGAIDLLVSAPDKARDNLMRKLLFEDEFVTAQRRDHPRGKHKLDLDAFCALKHLLVSADGGGFYGQIDSALASLGRTRQVAVSIQSYALAPALLSSTDCVCTMPRRYFSRHAAELDLFRPPLELPPLQMLALWHSRSQSDQGHAWLREQLYATVWKAAT